MQQNPVAVLYFMMAVLRYRSFASFIHGLVFCVRFKGGTYDSELMRALRERDEMKSMLDKYERHLSEIQANVRVLTAERDKTGMQYQQVGHAEPNSNSSTHWLRFIT